MREVDPKLFSCNDLRELVRRMIVANQVKNYDLTATYGGIGLCWKTDLSEDQRTIFCEMRGPGWTLHATIGQDAGRLDFDDHLFLDGSVARFETDIIYLKIAIA